MDLSSNVRASDTSQTYCDLSTVCVSDMLFSARVCCLVSERTLSLPHTYNSLFVLGKCGECAVYKLAQQQAGNLGSQEQNS